ncbi:putative two-component histidine kinase [Gordonia rhizosphera NBRC 16068]|uniref:histidine kinase n=2 Tax=Gordonia rhizosphera TaxID=83341 RepID=K6W3Z4_9ACTN|nr:putative two-component histidine kinase [Gordonia rhizosphera NBRC 16068]
MRMRRMRPRTLAGQAFAWLLAMVAVIVISGSVLAVLDARVDAEHEARQEVEAVAVSLATAPSTAAALTSSDPTTILQPMAEQVRGETGVAFITIMGPDGTRYTHPDPSLIGQHYIGSVDQALRGEVYTETFTGTLGPSVRTIAPVRAPDGRIVGLVSAGITLESLTAGWLAQLPLIITIAAAALLTAGAGLWLIRRRLLHQTGGLAPRELRLMYEHHDAVLHAIREGVVVTEGGRAVLANDEARRLLDDVGEADSTGDGVRLPEFLSGGDEPIVDHVYAEAGRTLMVSRSPVPGERGSSVVTLRDRTELSEAMGELDSMRGFAEALRSQAHESANRLHTIVALIEMGRSEEAVRMATTDLEVSQDLIDRIDETIGEPAIGALLLGKIAQAAERGIALTVTDDSRLPGDGATQALPVGEMITVLGNLIDNALDACDPDDPWVEVTVVGDATTLSIVVADSGPGMDPDEFTRAQTRGYTTKAGGDAAGRGLGLALVAQVVGRRHGTITAEQTYGSVITVTVGDTGGGNDSARFQVQS